MAASAPSRTALRAASVADPPTVSAAATFGTVVNAFAASGTPGAAAGDPSAVARPSCVAVAASCGVVAAPRPSSTAAGGVGSAARPSAAALIASNGNLDAGTWPAGATNAEPCQAWSSTLPFYMIARGACGRECY